MEINSKNKTGNETNQEKPEITTSENDFKKTIFSEVSVKETVAIPDIQDVLRRNVAVPEVVVIKKVKKAFKADGAEHKTQKIGCMCGTSLENAFAFELTLVDTELGDEAINKKYHIVDYTFALEANMAGGKFSGYAAKGLKLMVSKLEEV